MERISDSAVLDKSDSPSLHCMADVEPEEVDWLWFPRIPLKHVTMLEGDPGEGKSFLTQAIATALSLGGGLSDINLGVTSNTLLLTAEDHLPTTVRPRLEAMGADVKRIFALDDALPLDVEGLNRLGCV